MLNGHLRLRIAFAFVCLVLCFLGRSAEAQQTDLSAAALKKLSLEELLNIEVTSVARTEESLGESAAAVTVVTNEDIRRSGAINVPEALRLVPGLHVARQTADLWTVNSRGFSSANSEKLLVLSDTRSIYTPLFSGVFWDVQDYLLQDIDRIEVIRGPGATLWGSNAVNGVINITTKSAKDTQGLYVESSAGSDELGVGGVRYGGKAGGLYYRFFGRYFERSDSFHSQAATSDDSRLGHFGFRTDWDANNQDSITFQGDLYRANIGRLSPSVNVIGRDAPGGNLEVLADGGNLLGRWKHTINQGSDLQVRMYYDRTRRDDPSFIDTLDTMDLDLQHHFSVGTKHDVIWGSNYRFTDDRNRGKGVLALDPPQSRDNLVSGFVQDQITVFHPLRVTLGTKLEHNAFSGFEVQPSARASWQFSPSHMGWVAVSRAARVPTRLERDIAVDVTNPAGNPVYRLLGNTDFDSEKLTAYELGYRGQIVRTLSVDVSTFYNRYTDLDSLEFDKDFVDPSGKTVRPILNKNLNAGRSKGIETLLVYSPLEFWRVTVSHSYLHLNVDTSGLDLNRGRFLAGATPSHQLGLRSFLDLPHNFQFDADFRHLTAIRQLPSITNGTGIPGYSELDARLAWRGWKRVEISLAGQNLLHNHHAEFGAPDARGEIKRSVYGKIAWGF